MSGARLTRGCRLLLFVVFLSGCISMERSYPDKHYFTLNINISGAGNPGEQPIPGTLEVAELQISSRYGSQSFVYRISETGFESDFYNQFLIAPAAQITEEIRKGMAQRRIFDHVIDSSSQLQPTHRLEGTIYALYGDFNDSSTGRAVLDIQFFLTRQGSAGTEVLMDKRYQQSIPLARRSPEALVKGWNEALQSIMNNLLANLRSIS